MRAPTVRSSQIGSLARFWTRPSVLFAVVACSVFLSFVLDWLQAGAAMNSVARERGAALFRLIELSRDWNARHGGVYVPVQGDTRPNPYLEHPRRDLTTRDGTQLTMVNPAYMTRQIGEIAQEAEGIRLHITSLKPINPANVPDDWEASALRAFEAGTAEVIALVPGNPPVHRFMAPLRVKETCLQCHARQDYSVGQVRGGISITMPASQLLAIRDADRTRSAALHVLTLGIAAALLHLLFRRTRSHVAALEAIAVEQERVIEERTGELSRANEALERELADRELAAAVFESAGEAIIVLDADGNFVQVNPAFVRMTGYASEEVVGESAALLKSGHHPPEFYVEFWQLVKQQGSWQGEVWNRRRNGELFVVWMSIRRVDHDGMATRYVATLTDITHSKELEEELRHRAYHDPLTDLPNRALFADRLRVAISQARRHERGFALCYIDLDAFKPVNDSLGHAAGDELLVETARRLRAVVRASDTVARLGGDEFGVIISEVDSRAEVDDVAVRIVADLARPFTLAAGEAHISCSMGIALFPQHGVDADGLQRSADAALYAVKGTTGNGYLICAEAPGTAST